MNATIITGGWADLATRPAMAVAPTPPQPSVADELRAMLDRLSTAVHLLRLLVGDDLTGWTVADSPNPILDPRERWLCVYCGATETVEEGRDDPPHHLPTCPVRRARDLLGH